MKKFYALAVVLFFALGSASAQNFYWIGPANGNWDAPVNWSSTSGGPAGAVAPGASTDNVIFDANATVRMNVNASINSVSVTGTTTVVTITAINGSKDLTVNSTNAVSPGLLINAGCRLVNTSTGSPEFSFTFVDGGKATINGDWMFTGDFDNYAFFNVPDNSSGNTAVTINSGGSITIGANTVSAPNENGDNTIIFNSGSSLNILSELAIIPVGNYRAGSTINITGVINEGPTFEESGSVGTINYNCPSQNASVSLDLLLLTVTGNLNIQNTNNKELVLMDNTEPGLSSKLATINGNLNIQGTSAVTVASNTLGDEPANTLTVKGNVIANGTSFNIHTGPNISTNFTKIAVGGNIQHTAGTFGSSSTVINESTNLYIIELNGSGNQNISSVTGTFDNAGHQVTLRMNNSAGATMLNALQIGRIDFNSPNKGVLTTGGNLLSINNATTASIVVNSPSATGYINGTVQRKSQSLNPLIIPVGSASGYRPATLIPSSAALTTFEATFFNTAYSDLSTASPLEGVSPDYYWIINRISGSADAAVQFSLPGAITGAQADYALVVAKYNGADWTNEKGTTGTSIVPGNSTSGTLKSQVESNFSPFTIGFGLASALPTHLVSFTGKKSAKETIDLRWQITDNSTPEIFEVTRSNDGVNFVKIGTVAGAESVRTYQFTDQSILAGNNYYRLRMLDRDGAVTFSTIVVVSNGAQGVFLHSLSPSVVRSRTKLNIQSSVDANMQVVITDVNGRIVNRQSLALINGSQDIWLDASGFASGIYQVTGVVKGEKIATLRFIKL